MRIISTFKDFYDIFDGDPEPLFVRKTQKTHIQPGDKRTQLTLGVFWEIATPKNHIERYHWSDPVVSHVFLAFCGNVYHWWAYGSTLTVSFDEVLELARSEVSKTYMLRLENTAHKESKKPTLSHKTVIPDEIFRTMGAPYFTLAPLDCHPYDGHILTTCPNLQQMGIDKIWKKPDTWQEISMYLGNQLATQAEPPIARTQELIRDAHGFDKFSFKSQNSERKIRRGQK
jgi:hypothetical protein